MDAINKCSLEKVNKRKIAQNNPHKERNFFKKWQVISNMLHGD